MKSFNRASANSFLSKISYQTQVSSDSEDEDGDKATDKKQKKHVFINDEVMIKENLKIKWKKQSDLKAKLAKKESKKDAIETLMQSGRYVK